MEVLWWVLGIVGFYEIVICFGTGYLNMQVTHRCPSGYPMNWRLFIWPSWWIDWCWDRHAELRYGKSRIR